MTLDLQTGEEAVRIEGDQLVVRLADIDDYERKKMLIETFVWEQCQTLFTRLVEELTPKLACYDVEMPKVRLRRMKTRWGSCSPARRSISLNMKLLETAPGCIEYVVLHELCHFVHPNHSKAFYALLERLMPDWKERKQALDQRERQLAEGISPLVVT